TADTDKPDERPTMPVPTPREAAANRRIDAEVARLKRHLDTWTPARVASLVGNWTFGVPAEVLALRGRIARLEKSRPKVTMLPVMVELPPGQRRETQIMRKGNFLDLGDKVEPGMPAAFHPLPTGVAADRLALAHWLVDPANPLTARVAVNRLWAQFFG